MDIDITELSIQKAKKRNFNRICPECSHCEIHMYEDDTPASYASCGWWMGRCGVLDVPISATKARPKDCPLRTKS